MTLISFVQAERQRQNERLDSASCDRLYKRLSAAIPDGLPGCSAADSGYLLKGTLPSDNQRTTGVELSALLREMVVNSDAVVVGTITSQELSGTTSGEDFLYTPFRVAIEKSLTKGKGSASLKSQIIIVRAGGFKSIDGMNVVAVDPDFAWQHVGTRYVLFLHKLETGDVYRIFPGGVFTFASNGHLNGQETMRPNPVLSYDSLISEIKEAELPSKRNRFKQP